MMEQLESLIKDGYLQHIENSPLTRANGVIAVLCGDCDRSAELLSYERDLCDKTSKSNRVHLLALNGGALSLHPESPVNQAGKSTALILDIAGTPALKQINDLALYAHYECGQAKALGLNFEDYLTWLARAGQYCKEQFPNLNIACKLHVEVHTDTDFKTYYFDHLKWLSKA